MVTLESLSPMKGTHLVPHFSLEIMGCSGPRRKVIIWWPALEDIPSCGAWTDLCSPGLCMVVSS